MEIFSSKKFKLDNISGALINTSFEHHEIHEGDTYSSFNHATSVNNNDYLEFFLTTPAVSSPQKRIHLLWRYMTSDLFLFQVFENVTRTSGGTLRTPLNRLRGGSASVITDLYSGWSGGYLVTGGTPLTLHEECGGVKEEAGGGQRDVNEWVLAPNTGYHFKLTSGAAANRMSIHLIWYEHTDSN